LKVVAIFETGDLQGLASCEIYMRDALEAAGIKFPPISADPRRAPNAVAYAPPATPRPRPAAKARSEEPQPLTAIWSAMRTLLGRTFGG
jgi:hypothetical protein